MEIGYQKYSTLEKYYDDDYDEEDLSFLTFDITSTPNDFNITTINNFIETGAVKIPGFQRNYIWDIGRASRLIESIILGLPIPQIFFYEESRNKFLVIDGQQRLMSIYYFIKKRFPKKDKRVELREIFDQHGTIPEKYLYNSIYFEDFFLKLPERLPGQANKFKNLNYSTLDEYKIEFDLRPLRCIIVKQNSPDDDSSMFEIFNRLNTGGVNLTPQEIRSSLYHSDFYKLLHKLNLEKQWRDLLRFCLQITLTRLMLLLCVS